MAHLYSSIRVRCGSSSWLLFAESRDVWRSITRSKSGLADIFFKRRATEEDQFLQKFGRQKLMPGKVSPRLPVPAHIPKPSYVLGTPCSKKSSDECQSHNAFGVARMRASSHLAAQVLKFAGTLVQPGVTTDEIDKAAHKMIIDAGAYPSPLGYHGFPKSICTSINECICHGIPDSRPLQDGDIINIDVTVYLDGYHGDTSKTFLCGAVNDDARKLVEVTQECLEKAIAACGPGVELNKIGKTINDHADKFKYGVVRQFVGHGVGKIFHSAPIVMHYRNNERGHMLAGQTFTIEPMLTIGNIDDMTWSDGWTCVTADGGLSAQFEHTLLITEAGVEILTL